MEGSTATDSVLDTEALQGFVAGVRGAVLRPENEGYDDARSIWNGLIDRRPALVVQCTGAAYVVDAVNFARERAPSEEAIEETADRRRSRTS